MSRIKSILVFPLRSTRKSLSAAIFPSLVFREVMACCGMQEEASDTRNHDCIWYRGRRQAERIADRRMQAITGGNENVE